MDAIMQIQISVQSAQALAALSAVEGVLGKVAAAGASAGSGASTAAAGISEAGAAAATASGAVATASVALDAYGKLSGDLAVAQRALRNAVLEEGAASDAANVARQKTIELAAKQIAADGEVAAATREAAASIALTSESSLLLSQTLSDGLGAMEKWGKQTQWTGRQIEYTLGLPLIIVGGIATKFAFDNQRALERLQRVYVSTSGTVSGTTHEITLLSTAFKLLSDKYGTNQAQVIDIATSWAKLGASGTNLVKVVQSTLDVMALSGMSNTDATKTLIALRQQYGLTASGMQQALAIINEAANHSGISFADMAGAFIRGGGAAVAAGVDIRHFAALVSAIAPAAGSADLAATGLKTVFSRLLAPSKTAATALGEVGININSTAWQSANGAQRIEMLAKAFEKLTPAQQAAAASTIASRFQITRFDVLMRDVLNPMGQYNRSLRSTADNTKVLQDYTNQVTHYLSSQPQAFKIALTQIENALAQIILPILPHVLAFVDQIVRMVQWFSNLSPRVQQVIVSLAGFVVIFGVALRVMGATTQMIARIGQGLLFLAEKFGIVGAEGESSALMAIGPWLVLAGVAALVAYAFRSQLSDLWNWVEKVATEDIPQWWDDMVTAIADAVGQLPTVFAQAFQDVVQIVEAAAKDVYSFFSYLNPFARHSPSLVENVQKGMTHVGNHYDAVTDKAVGFKDAHIDAHTTANAMPLTTRGPGGTAVAPGYSFTPSGDSKQQLAQVNTELKKQNAILRDLTATEAKYKNELDAAKQALSNYAQTPIQGMQAMEDRINANKLAQDKLNLSIMKMEDAYGTVEQLTSSMSKLNGQMQLLEGRKTSLHNAGAGSDVTGAIDQQMQAVSQQQAGLRGHAAEIDALTKKLNALQRAGQEIDLEKSIKFDPLTQQIQKLANTQKEMPFDWIISHVRQERAAVNQLTTEYNNAAKAVAAQRAIVNALNDLKSGFGSSSGSGKKKSSGFDAFKAAGTNSFATPNVGNVGFGKPGNLDSLIADMKKAADGFSKIDLFGGIKKQIDKFLGNTGQRIGFGVGAAVGGGIGFYFGGPFGAAIGAVLGGVLGRIIGGLHWGAIWAGLKAGVGAAVSWLGGAMSDIAGFIAPVAGWFSTAFGAAAGFVTSAMHVIGGWLTALGRWMQPVIHELGQWGGTFQRVFYAVGLVVRVVFGLIVSQGRILLNNIRTILHAIGVVFSAVWGVIGPSVLGVMHNIVGGISTLLHLAWDIIRTILGVIRAQFMTDLHIVWTIVKGVFTGMRDTITGILQTIRGIINFVLDLITGKWKNVWGDIKTFTGGVINTIKGLVLDPIHVIGDVIGQALTSIDSTWRRIWGGIKTFMSDLWSHISDGVKGPLNFVISAVGHAINFVLGLLADAADAYNSIPFVTHIHIPRHVDIPKLATGGTATEAGLALVGERGPELLHLPKGASVIPLGGGSSKSSHREIHFHGELVFPNVKGGHDAEEFIKNLEALATT